MVYFFLSLYFLRALQRRSASLWSMLSFHVSSGVTDDAFLKFLHDSESICILQERFTKLTIDLNYTKSQMLAVKQTW